MFSFLGVPVDAAYHLVSGLTGVLTPVLGGLAAVAAIIAFTMAVRLLLMPLSLRALRGQAVQARLAPQLLALRQRYGKQPERLQRELSALYKREGTSMFAGIAPLLLQWPFLSVMYLLFRSPTVGGTPNTLLTRDLFGVPLGTHWLSGVGPASAQGAVFLGVFVLLAGLCWLSARLGRLMSAQAGRGSGRLRAAGQGAALPDRGHRRVRAACGRDLPAYVAGLVTGRAGALLAIGRRRNGPDSRPARPARKRGPAARSRRPDRAGRQAGRLDYSYLDRGPARRAAVQVFPQPASGLTRPAS